MIPGLIRHTKTKLYCTQQSEINGLELVVFLLFTQFMIFFFEASSIQALRGAVIILLSPHTELLC